ncbi:PPE domain-containing protein, partial [Nocardia takedensis]
MVEPPEAGFTGVVWEARPPERLAHELTTGPGSAPLGEAAAAWGRVAASFAAAVVDYDRIMLAVRGHWRSGTSDAVLARISTMRDWLAETAAAAARNAEHAGRQAAAFEIARLSMPHVAEIAALEQALRTLKAVGASLGSPVVGAIADHETEQDLAKATAARVMRTYEAATLPLSESWGQTDPPTLSTPEAYEAEQAATRAATTASALPALSAMPAMPVIGPISVPRVLSGGQVHSVSQTYIRPEVTPVQAPVPTGTAAGQSLPPAAAPLAAAA